MGTDHARFLTTSVGGARVAAVSDPDTGRAREVADGSGGAVIDDPVDLIGDDRVDAVVIASPDPTHKPLTLACLAAGKPVLCEKPLATSSGDCLEIIDAEASTGRRLIQIGFMRRFDPGYVAMKTALAAGDLGAALIFHCVHRNATAASYTTSENLIANTAVHEFDIARWLLDDEAERVTVVSPRASSLGGMKDPQIILLHMTAGSVVDAEIFVNAQYGYDVRAELVCEHGTVSLTPPNDIQLRHAAREGFGHPEDWRPRFAAAYRDELQAWIASVKGGPPAGASAWDGYAATAIAEAGLASLASGATASVDLQPRPALYHSP